MRWSRSSMPCGHAKLRGVTRLPRGAKERKLLSGAIINCCVVLGIAASYNPCNQPGLATRGRGFYLGVAFWPGGSTDDWGPVYNATSKTFGLNPCNNVTLVENSTLTQQQYLELKGVTFAAFKLRVDTLNVMRFNKTDIDALLNSTALNKRVVSVILFRSEYRSEARYVVSEDAETAGGTGYINTLATAATFSRGKLTYLQWDDLTCNSCGGRSSPTCIVSNGSQPQYSCAVAKDSCSSETLCSLSIYMGSSGNDKSGVSLTSGFMIHRLNQYSITTLYETAKQQNSPDEYCECVSSALANQTFVAAQLQNILSRASSNLLGEQPQGPNPGVDGEAA